MIALKKYSCSAVMIVLFFLLQVTVAQSFCLGKRSLPYQAPAVAAQNVQQVWSICEQCFQAAANTQRISNKDSAVFIDNYNNDDNNDVIYLALYNVFSSMKPSLTEGIDNKFSNLQVSQNGLAINLRLRI